MHCFCCYFGNLWGCELNECVMFAGSRLFVSADSNVRNCAKLREVPTDLALVETMRDSAKVDCCRGWC